MSLKLGYDDCYCITFYGASTNLHSCKLIFGDKITILYDIPGMYRVSAVAFETGEVGSCLNRAVNIYFFGGFPCSLLYCKKSPCKIAVSLKPNKVR